MSRPSNKLRFIIGLALIAILFSVYNVYLLDGSWFLNGTSRQERYIIKFASVLIVYAMGVFAFKGRPPGWLLLLWHILYGALLLLLVLLALIEAYVQQSSGTMRGLGVSVHMFLISPLPYFLLAIIGSTVGRMANRS